MIAQPDRSVSPFPIRERVITGLAGVPMLGLCILQAPVSVGPHMVGVALLRTAAEDRDTRPVIHTGSL